MTAILLFLALTGMFQRASVVQMDMVPCALPQHSVLSALAGAPAAEQSDSCAEYVIMSQTVVFRVQTKRSEVLMVPGELVSFRAGKGKLHLRRDDNQGELEATVLCMRGVNAPGDACGMKKDEETSALKATKSRERRF